MVIATESYVQTPPPILPWSSTEIFVIDKVIKMQQTPMHKGAGLNTTATYFYFETLLL